MRRFLHEESQDETVAMFASPGEHTYRIQIECDSLATDTGCLGSRACDAVPNGRWYTVFRDGVEYARVCLSPHVADDLGAITPAMVAREFRRLSWPAASLRVAPPDGRTLINLPVVFSTDPAGRQLRTVTLLGQSVTIEATPTNWTWQPGVGEASWQSSDPGRSWAPGSDVGSLNTHTYLHPGPYDLSVDVTYSGRYRINGQPWQDIATTLTVPGPATPLEVIEARSHLTGP